MAEIYRTWKKKKRFPVITSYQEWVCGISITTSFQEEDVYFCNHLVKGIIRLISIKKKIIIKVGESKAKICWHLHFILIIHRNIYTLGNSYSELKSLRHPPLPLLIGLAFIVCVCPLSASTLRAVPTRTPGAPHRDQHCCCREAQHQGLIVPGIFLESNRGQTIRQLCFSSWVWFFFKSGGSSWHIFPYEALQKQNFSISRLLNTLSSLIFLPDLDRRTFASQFHKKIVWSLRDLSSSSLSHSAF